MCVYDVISPTSSANAFPCLKQSRMSDLSILCSNTPEASGDQEARVKTQTIIKSRYILGRTDLYLADSSAVSNRTRTFLHAHIRSYTVVWRT